MPRGKPKNPSARGGARTRGTQNIQPLPRQPSVFNTLIDAAQRVDTLLMTKRKADQRVKDLVARQAVLNPSSTLTQSMRRAPEQGALAQLQQKAGALRSELGEQAPKPKPRNGRMRKETPRAAIGKKEGRDRVFSVGKGTPREVEGAVRGVAKRLEREAQPRIRFRGESDAAIEARRRAEDRPKNPSGATAQATGPTRSRRVADKAREVQALQKRVDTQRRRDRLRNRRGRTPTGARGL